ncbi:MAG: dephospho-CoA kinase [Coraliomargarita sp.]
MRVGLTGGIGCGKSTVVKFFAEAGWRTLESDRIVAAVLANDPEVHTELRNRFGDQVFDADGGVDRKAIAARVFSDEAALKWLEALLHLREHR